ncbi:MAG: mannose-1-phosphate guanylyltransferase/mannose-6-phosphate isomerase [Deltaproteobacteria bacterium]|nr:mannose-1-phosphate guanylyltransferase/mannose-6-phosphate isomerase [Deltaproteobacteria bacterium]
MLHPVVLSGGSGTRLWPLSRKFYPKQLLPLVGEETMIQTTIGRAASLPEAAPPIVICNEAHRFLVAEQIQEARLPHSVIVLEPEGRNTAPAAAVAAILALGKDPEAMILVMPADHVMTEPQGFAQAVRQGLPYASQNLLLTFGIRPDRPETGYGYILQGRALDDGSDRTLVHAVDQFVEKPDLETARAYVESGDYLWNSGIFLMSAATYLEELERFLPEALASCRRAVDRAASDLDFLRLDPESFRDCPSDSIDYAVMEKTDRAAVVSMEAGWSDVGSWSALIGIGSPDENGNVCRGDVMAHGSRNNYLHASHRLVATVGLENHIVVETKDAVLVASLDKAQDVKAIVERLVSRDREEHLLHRKVYRPWGSYEGIDTGDRFQVKRITVKPGQVLSLQMHHHRAEHWIVVRGTAKVTNGEKTFLLGEDQSTYIPLGTVHRLENPGKIPLELIEVQTGSYVGEDDIQRYEDLYGRAEPSS